MNFARRMVAAGAMFASLAASAQVVYTVTVPGDPLDTVGLPLPGTLRYAITAANANCVASTAFAPTINFAISGATFGPGPYAIRPPLGIPLPPLTCDSTTIDATTQSGWSPNGPTLDGADNANLVVILDGSACGSGCSGLEVQAQDTAIKGLSIHSFRNAGIYVASGGYSRIQGNYIGTDPGAMNTSLGNSIGVYVDGGQAVIGGSGATDAQFSNLIAGNAADGILVSSGSSSVQIYGNHIGGNRDGSAGNANGIGVHFASGSSSHEVEQNFIRYNSSGGVVVGSGALFITRNSIHHNNSEGIALFDANAPPPPVITSVTNDGVNTTVSGFVSAPAYPTNPVQVEIFTNSAQPLYPEGETYRDPPVSFSLASGFGTFTATIPGIQPYVTATATIDTCFEDCLSTSEFSIPVQPPVAVGLFNPPLVTPTGTTELVFIVGNPNASSMSGVQYTLVVPLPLKIAAAPTWDADCGSDFGRGSDITAGTVSVFALNLAPGQGCTVHVPVVTPPPRSTPYTIPASSMAVSSSFGSAQPSADAVLIVTEPTLFALPPSVDFGNVAVGTVGSATVSVNNIGLAAGNIAAVTVSGAGFALGPETCSAHTVPPSSSEVTSPCSVTVTFTPASAAPSTGQLLVTYDGSSSPLAVPLLAQGTAGLLQVSPSDVDFGGVFVGDAMTADVTLTNTGNAALNFSSIAISNPPGAVVFTQALSGAPCGSALAAGAACVVRVKFAPAASGTPYSGTLNVASNDPGAPTASIALLGQGTAQAPTVSPPSIAFGNVPVGGSAIIPVTVTNTAQVPLSFLFRVVGAGFSFIPSVPTLCPSPLPPAATCSVAVRFAPTTAGPFTGTFEVDGGGGTTPRLVNAALSGTGSGGSAPVASLSSGTLTFTAQAVGTTSPAQLVVLTNGGTAPLDITSIAIAGDFGYTGCGFPLTLAPGASCTFSVTFSPIANGTRTGSITITDNAAGSPHVVNLVGTGANGPQPSIEVRPFALDFGDVRVGVQHSDVVTITSNGTAPLAISSISIAGPGFTQSNTCPASLPVGGSCQVTVSFVPAATGPYGSTMTIASNADPGNFNVSLAGNGVPTPPAILTVDRFVDFGQQTIGTTTRLSLELRNTGEQALSVNALDLRGAAFGIEGSCAAIVPGGACTVTLVFTPPSIAVFTGSLTIASNDARGAIRVDILGEGVALPRPEIELSVDGIGFANQFITTQSPSQTVSVRSVGSAPLQIHGVSVTGPFVLTGNGCPGTLASGAHCDVSVAFLPFAPGVGQGVLTVDSDAEAGRGFASLTGTGCRFFTIAGLRTLQPLCQ